MTKQILLSIAALCWLSGNAYSQVIYVRQGGQGTGTSWLNATDDLQYALQKATYGTEIWVAAGTYYPVDCTSCTELDRQISFTIPDGVKLLGGFSGEETRVTQRNWQRNVTTLSGNIGREDCLDNSYTVVYTRGVSAKTFVDGFIITDGHANGDTHPGHPFRSGGGWYNDGQGRNTRSNPTISHCLFLNNQAKEGAGMFNNGEYGTCNPFLLECVFSGNQAVFGGGALFNHGLTGDCRVKLESCQFVNNFAAFGAGIFTACLEDQEPSVEHCQFINNKAKRGGGLFYLGINYKPWLRTNRFLNNQSIEGEDIFVMKGRRIPEKLLAIAGM